MSFYEIAKDALKLAQKTDNIELVQKIIDLQLLAVDMQNEMTGLNKTIEAVREENSSLKKMRQLDFADGEIYLIDKDYPDRHFCPVCTRKLSVPVPLSDTYCTQCKSNFQE